MTDKTKEELLELLHNCDDERMFCVFEALKKGIPTRKIHEITKIDNWFLDKLHQPAQDRKQALANYDELTEGALSRVPKSTAFWTATIER